MQQLLTSIIDIFYPPFKRLMPLQTFRYAACGGGNMMLGLILYYVFFNFVFQKTYVSLGFFALEGHNAAMFLSGAVTFTVGFLLNKFIVFTASNIEGKKQLFRYFLSFSTNLIFDYFLLKLFIKVWHWEEFFAQVVATTILVLLSYLTQKHFSFKEEV